MNGKLEVIKATAVSKHTGIVWGASFPYPSPKFLDDMGWRASDNSGRNLQWEAYGMRKIMVGGKPVLEMRFRDRGWTPVPEGSDVTVELITPMP
jgi:hypothetical protein